MTDWIQRRIWYIAAEAGHWKVNVAGVWYKTNLVATAPQMKELNDATLWRLVKGTELQQRMALL